MPRLHVAKRFSSDHFRELANFCEFGLPLFFIVHVYVSEQCVNGNKIIKKSEDGEVKTFWVLFPISPQVNKVLAALQSEVENFILRMAAEFPLRKEQLIFLINNYDMMLSVLMVSWLFLYAFLFH